MDVESTIEDVLKNIPRFRILCVGRAGVGKSSLVNRIFRITEAKVSDYTPGRASIDKEFVSDENKYFVLHDSEGFEPANNTNFELVAQFLRRRRLEELQKDRLHAVWLCIETPRAGGRVLEEGDKKLLALAHELETPVVVVFTKYDKLVRSKRLELEEEGYGLDKDALRETTQLHASKALATSIQSLDELMGKLKIPTRSYANISVYKGYEDSIANLVDITRKVVHERLKDDAWVTWAVAQRANLPMKIEMCIDKGVNFYYSAFVGSVPGAGNMLLRQCLAQVHRDIVTCWNFKDQAKILDGAEFGQLMLYLVQDLQTESLTTPAPALDKIAQFVSLVTASQIHVVPPVAILGLTYFFVKWVSDAALQRIPEIECLLMAYSIDLISVLKSLFNITLKPDLAGTTNWEVLKLAFEEYERSNRRKEIHDFCLSFYKTNGQILSRADFRWKIRKLLEESP